LALDNVMRQEVIRRKYEACREARDEGSRSSGRRMSIKAKLRHDRSPVSGPTQVRAIGFVAGVFEILTVVDASPGFRPQIDLRHSFRGSDVVQTFELRRAWLSAQHSSR
jgi:putative transposase